MFLAHRSNAPDVSKRIFEASVNEMHPSLNLGPVQYPIVSIMRHFDLPSSTSIAASFGQLQVASLVRPGSLCYNQRGIHGIAGLIAGC